jgi:hypothetical protein
MKSSTDRRGLQQPLEGFQPRLQVVVERIGLCLARLRVSTLRVALVRGRRTKRLSLTTLALSYRGPLRAFGLHALTLEVSLQLGEESPTSSHQSDNHL